MTVPASELAIRASALYLPISISLALAVHFRPNRRQVGSILVAVAWNLVALLAVNAVAVNAQWWAFAGGSATVAGTPVELWIGWTLLWSAVPLLLPLRWIPLAGVALVAADLVLMRLAGPVVLLRSSWLVGESVAVVTSLLPGLVLGTWTQQRSNLRARATLQVGAFAGLLFFVLPSIVFELTREDWSVLLDRPRWHFVVASCLAAPFAATALQAVIEFARVGTGTPVPLDPPARLVTSGPYAYVANPMQLGATVLLGLWAFLVASPALAAATAMAVVFSSGLAAWSEEAELTERFGGAWTDYRQSVRTWLPRWRPIAQSDQPTVFVGVTCDPCSDVGRFLRTRTNSLVIEAAEESGEDFRRITYRRVGHSDASGLAAVGRSIEHINLAWAVASWIGRLPLVLAFLQLVADAVGVGPRRLAGTPSAPCAG